jgi:hypothetical protein
MLLCCEIDLTVLCTMEQPEVAEKPHPGAVDEVQQTTFQDPQKLPFWRKAAITAILACCTLSVTLCSSIFSSALVVTAEEFKTTTEVMMLGVSLYVLGFAVGPLFWGMLNVSERLHNSIDMASRTTK